MSDLIIDYSVIESELLGMRVGRCQSEHFKEEDLLHQSLSGKFDLVRLKVPAEDEMAQMRLYHSGLPNFFSGSIRKYKTKIGVPPEGDFNYPDLVFETYDGTQDVLLKDMIRGTWGNYPIGYYRTPYLDQTIDKEIEIDCLFRFYKKYNLQKDYPANSIRFIRQGDRYVGFFALNHLNGNLESHIGGILEPYRRGGYFLDKLRFIKLYCLEHGLEHFLFGARNENAGVQRIFQYVGFQPIGTDNVFHLPLLLSMNQQAEQHLITGAGGFPAQLAEKLVPGFTKMELKTVRGGDLLLQSGQKLLLRFPLLSDRYLSTLLLDEETGGQKIWAYLNQW